MDNLIIKTNNQMLELEACRKKWHNEWNFAHANKRLWYWRALSP